MMGWHGLNEWGTCTPTPTPPPQPDPNVSTDEEDDDDDVESSVGIKRSFVDAGDGVVPKRMNLGGKTVRQQQRSMFLDGKQLPSQSHDLQDEEMKRYLEMRLRAPIRITNSHIDSIYFQTVPINVMCKLDVQCSGSVTGSFARMDFELGTSISVNDLQHLLRNSFQQLDKHVFTETYVNGCLQVSATFTVVSDTSIVFGMKDKPQPALQQALQQVPHHPMKMNPPTVNRPSSMIFGRFK